MQMIGSSPTDINYALYLFSEEGVSACSMAFDQGKNLRGNRDSDAHAVQQQIYVFIG